jgi:Pyruvate/2-oxoacid:ferredoxin oxidoreductase delta subunit
MPSDFTEAPAARARPEGAAAPPAPARSAHVVLDAGPAGPATMPPERRLDLLDALLTAGYCVTVREPSERPSGTELRSPRAEAAPTAGPASPGLAVVISERDPVAGGGVDGAIDATGLAPAQVVAAVEAAVALRGAPRPGLWKPWFPVIDTARCTNCMQCLSFCLFDVYGVDARRQIEVRNHQKCKTNCPACSRVCPEVAIMFPKYGRGPINGDEVSAADVDREKMKIDVSALLGGDVYALLRDRHARAASRFSRERDEARALKERMTCLANLGRDLDVPPEVLMALPSREQIEDRARSERSARSAPEAPTHPGAPRDTGEPTAPREPAAPGALRAPADGGDAA